MRILRDIPHVPEDAKDAVLAVGNFDGMHQGHLAMLAEVKAIAQHEGKRLAVMVFEPHPRRVHQPHLPPLALMGFADKARMLERAGVEDVLVARLTLPFTRTSAEMFIEEWLHKMVRASHVVAGANFVFGANRKGNAELLTREAQRLGFKCTILQTEGAGRVVYTSNVARAALGDGKMELATQILGRHYSLLRPVIKGEGKSGAIGFPTANMSLPDIFMPRFGVYAARCRVVSWGRKVESEWMDAIAMLGPNPMMRSDGVARMDVHIMHPVGNLTRKRLEVELIAFLRDENVYDAMEVQKAQMGRDCESARVALQQLCEIA